MLTTPEHDRLAQSNDDLAAWRRWGPYVAGRQWGTVREDHSADGDAWSFFPFDDAQLLEGGRRPKSEPEYELIETGVLDQNRFFDVTIVHAKAAPDDVAVEYRVINRGPDAAPLDVLGQWWFRNTWSWGRDDRRPGIVRDTFAGRPCLTATHAYLGTYHLIPEPGPGGAPELLLCDNETNRARVFGPDAVTPDHPQPAHPKDAIDDAVVRGDRSALAADTGTKAAVWWHLDAARVVADRQDEADQFSAAVIPSEADGEDAFIARRAFAGLL